MAEADSFLLLIIAFLFPPAAVAFVTGCGPDLLLNILLTIIGWLPGCIHAFWLIFRRTEANQKFGQNNWTYTGMGEYHQRNAVAEQQQPPQPPAGAQEQTPPPSSEKKQAPPPAAEEQKEGDKPQDNQKQYTSDQKVADPAPQYTPIAGSSA